MKTMKLIRISPMPLALFTMTVQAVVGLIFGLAVTVMSLTGLDTGPGSPGIWAALLFPVLNAIFGFLAGLFMAWSYNTFSRMTGALELEFEDDQSPSLNVR